MQVFVPTDARSRHDFEIRELVEPLALTPDGGLTPLDAGPGSLVETAWLVPWWGPGPRRGALLVTRGGGVRLNGRPVLPVTVLRRGDEVRLGDASLFYTDEAPLRAIAYDPASRSAPSNPECTRCHGPIQPGDPVVLCPVCGAIYMAQPDRSPTCWDFGPCLSCGRDPGLEYVWQPDAARPPVPWHQRPWRTQTQAVL